MKHYAFVFILLSAVVGAAQNTTSGVARPDYSNEVRNPDVAPPAPLRLPPELAALIEEQVREGVAAKEPISRTIYDVLRGADPRGKYDGSEYALTMGNALPADWLTQTPNWWGRSVASLPVVEGCPPGTQCEKNPDFNLPYCSPAEPCAIGTCVTLAATNTTPGATPRSTCIGHSDWILDRFYKPLADGGMLLDVSTLLRPDDRFMAALRDAITVIARRGDNATIRVLIGVPVPMIVSESAVLGDLIRDAVKVPTARIRITVAKYRIHQSLWWYWNHSKIIANTDIAQTGGHNMYTAEYLLRNPVHDVSMTAHGPAARAAHGYLEPIWTKVCTMTGQSYDAAAKKYTRGCVAFPSPAAVPSRGSTTILTVGNYSAGIIPPEDPAYMSDLARITAIRRARRTLRFSQQDLGMALPYLSKIRIWWPEETLTALAEAILRDVDVYIVLSNFNAVGGGSTPYEYGIEPGTAASKIVAAAASIPGAPTGEALLRKMCSKLHFSTLRFNDTDDSWPGNKGFANHAKVWIVDDQAFYIGSDNIYPAWLQEFGFIVDDAAATQTLLADYWNKLWGYSKRVALSGSDAPRCMFRCELPSPAGFDFGWNDKPRVFADVNGDRRKDYCRDVNTDWISCALSTATGFVDGEFQNGPGFDFGGEPRAFADVNGDGAEDYCRAVSGRISCALGRIGGNSFTDGQFQSPNIDIGWGDQPRAYVDVTGDNKADYCRFVGTGGSFTLRCTIATATGFNGGDIGPSSLDAGWGNKPQAFVDVNGDRKTDYCRDVGPDILSCALSTGTGFVDGTYQTAAGFDWGWSNKPREFVDANGDGRADYCRDVGPDVLSCALSTGNGFVDGRFQTKADFDFGWGDQPRIFADATGDGAADYCRDVNGDALSCAQLVECGR